jgi:transposase
MIISSAPPGPQRPHPFDENTVRHPNLIERFFCRIKDWRRIASSARSPARRCGEVPWRTTTRTSTLIA